MHDSVSNWIDLLILAALTTVVGGILLPVFPLASLGFVGSTALTVFARRRRSAPRTTSQVIWEVEAEAAAALRRERA
jgi:hypothetical protein